MNHRHITSTLAALALTGTCLAAGVGASSAQVTDSQRTLGTRSVAQFLAADGHHFDRNWHDFDIVDKFFVKVLTVRPNSRLGIIRQGRKPVTAFLPTDGAFRRAAAVILGRHFKTERGVYLGFLRLGGVRNGVKNAVLHLLYHLVKGPALTYQQLAAEAPTTLTTMQKRVKVGDLPVGGKLEIHYRRGRLLVIDHDAVSPNARVIRSKGNLNEGNRQIAQGVSAFLSPLIR